LDKKRLAMDLVRPEYFFAAKGAFYFQGIIFKHDDIDCWMACLIFAVFIQDKI
jgi:hypothetical protein